MVFSRYFFSVVYACQMFCSAFRLIFGLLNRPQQTNQLENLMIRIENLKHMPVFISKTQFSNDCSQPNRNQNEEIP